jgi:hypothetical protein
MSTSALGKFLNKAVSKPREMIKEAVHMPLDIFENMMRESPPKQPGASKIGRKTR